MEKKVGVLGLAMTFAGSILGAGYVSGQELFQYFGAYGKTGIFGLVMSLVLIAACSVLVIWLSGRCRVSTLDDVVIRFNSNILRTTFGVVFTVIYYMITIVMISGIASLCEQLFGISRFPVAIIVSVIVMFIVYFGVDGMLMVFTMSVPVLVVATVIICLIQIIGSGLEGVQFRESATNPLLGGWFFSAVNYAACNSFATAGILTPLESRLDRKAAKYTGILVGSVLLLTIATAILGALATCPGATKYNLPMLNVAQNISVVIGYIYGVLLFLAMFGNAVATLVSVMNYLLTRTEFVRRHKLPTIIILGTVACCAAMVGFSRLVGIVYPIVGYIGIAAAVLMIEHGIHLSRK